MSEQCPCGKTSNILKTIIKDGKKISFCNRCGRSKMTYAIDKTENVKPKIDQANLSLFNEPPK